MKNESSQQAERTLQMKNWISMASGPGPHLDLEQLMALGPGPHLDLEHPMALGPGPHLGHTKMPWHERCPRAMESKSSQRPK